MSFFDRLAADHLQYGSRTRLQGLDWFAPPLQAEYRSRQAVVRDFKAAPAIGLQVGKTVEARPRAIHRRFQSESIF